MASKKLLLLVDGNAILHRAWHAIPPLTAPDGTVVNAVYGFLSLFFKAAKELKPSAIAVAWDRKEKTFRHELYKEYKATREKKPDELYTQIPIIQDFLRGLGVATVDAKGYEADDIIATLATESKDDVIILTGDMDALQLIGPKVKVVALRRGITDTVLYDADEFKKRYGFSSEQFVDYKALRGDPSDNIPGVPGIGEKTATELIQKFGSIEKMYKNLKRDASIAERLKTKLVAEEKTARESLRLVKLVRDVSLPKLDATLRPTKRAEAVAKLQALGFKSLLTRLPSWIVGGEATAPKTIRLLSRATEIEKFAEGIGEELVVRAIQTGSDKFGRTLVGLGLATEDGAAVLDLGGEMTNRLAPLRAALEDPKIKKIGHGLKDDIEALLGYGIELRGCAMDLEIASYLCAAGTRNHELGTLAFEELGLEIPPRAKPQGQLLPPTLADLLAPVGAELDAIRRLAPIFRARLCEQLADKLLDGLELPLIPVLATMEQNGVAIDTDFLYKLGAEMEQNIEGLIKKMTKLADEDFNPNSPKELQHILFEKLGIPAEGLRRTAKSGALSTAAGELDKLRGLHPIIDLLTEYRELAKLNSTYAQALPALVDPETGRVHTTYNQTVAATGRLSSSDPNLQNIPIRTAPGREIRRAFVAERDNVLLGFDYSQIELRIIASLADDKKMIEAFRVGRDIHTETASAIWGVEPEKVTKDMRRNAKTINFGIIYGMGPQGLAQGAEVSYAEAREFMEKYFDHYRGIADWIEDTKTRARERGYVETLLGRRRYLSDLASGIPHVRSAAERMAVNMPVQGTAADMIKLAMIRIHPLLSSRAERNGVEGSRHHARMILQVHDELVFEIPRDEATNLAPKIKSVMENVVSLKVPVVVDVSVGPNWGAMKPL